MYTNPKFRDYSLTGSDSGPSFDHDQWYISPVPRKLLKSLMQRSDLRAAKNCAIWLLLVCTFAAILITTWGTIWAWPVAFVYGIFYASAADSRWHEYGHGTPFRTRWMNDVVYQIASFMSLKNPIVWRWSHTRHHTDTVIVGRDPEIAFPRPPSIQKWILNLLHIPATLMELWKSVRLSAGILSESEKDFLPETEWKKAFWIGRAHLGILLVVLIASIAAESLLPIILVGLPTFYGSWLHHVLATTQHAGLAEDVPDHRMNSRTVYLNPLLRFIYSNMNYHVEHHMYPLVPFYNLPALHDAVKADNPTAYPSLYSCYREIVPAVIQQQTDPNYFVQRPLPKEANPTPDYKRPLIC